MYPAIIGEVEGGHQSRAARGLRVRAMRAQARTASWSRPAIPRSRLPSRSTARDGSTCARSPSSIGNSRSRTATQRELLRGLIHSDGCRTVNRFKTKAAEWASGEVRVSALLLLEPCRWTYARSSATTATCSIFAGRNRTRATSRSLTGQAWPAWTSSSARSISRTSAGGGTRTPTALSSHQDLNLDCLPVPARPPKPRAIRGDKGYCQPRWPTRSSCIPIGTRRSRRPPGPSVMLLLHHERRR